MTARHMQIGEVAERTALSLRTIRYYEEVGLAPPTARSQGGFRLYTERDVDRLLLIRRMKPLGFSLEEMRDLLELLDGLRGAVDGSPERRSMLDRLALHQAAAEQRIEVLRSQLASAQGLVAELAARVAEPGLRDSAGRLSSH